MAEEKKIGNVIPGEGEGSQSLSPAVTDEKRVELEEKAREKGWRPLEEWDGDPESWIDAKEFMGRQPLYDRIDGLKKDLFRTKQSYEQDFQTLSKEVAQMREIEYQRALANLKHARANAIQEDDTGEIRKLDDQIEQIVAARARAESAPNQRRNPNNDPAFQSWRERNSWFDNDQTLKQEAIRLGTAYGMTNPNASTEEACEYVEKSIKKLYPEKFKPMTRTPPSPEGSPTSAKTTTRTSRGNRLTVADLSDDQKKVMDTFLKRRVFKSAEEYLEKLSAVMPQSR